MSLQSSSGDHKASLEVCDPSVYRPAPAAAVGVFHQFFLNRTDTVAFAAAGTDPGPAIAGESLDSYLAAHVSGQPIKVRVPRQVGSRKSGTAGPAPMRFGTYSPATDGTTKYGCVDFD